MNCIVNVTEREYDKILQLNHDAVVWKTSDQNLLRDLEPVLGGPTVRQMCAFEQCKMQKLNDLAGHSRIEPDRNEPEDAAKDPNDRRDAAPDVIHASSS
jgi:hypothetical protein